MLIFSGTDLQIFLNSLKASYITEDSGASSGQRVILNTEYRILETYLQSYHSFIN